MKKNVIFFVLSIIGLFQLTPLVKAEYVLPFELCLSSKFYSGYPVVTDLFNCYFYDDVEDENCVKLSLLDVIVTVNGKDINGIEYEKLLELCSLQEELDLTVVRKYQNGDFLFNAKIKQKNNMHGYGDLKTVRVMSGGSFSVLQNNKDFYKSIRVLADSELDYQYYHTYDIMVTGDQPLQDKAILEAFCSTGLFARLTRDQENPDLIVCLAKSSDESISSTYVPPTTQVINEGSTAKPVYNYLTRTVSYEIKQNNRYERTEGYTEITTATNINLEIAVLDAKKLNDPNQTVAPILWQMNYSSNIANRDFEVMDIYMKVAKSNCFPFTDPDIGSRYTFAMIGAVLQPYDDESVIVASEIVPGTNADRLGLQKGDIITKINGKKSFKISMDVGSLEFRPKFKCSDIPYILSLPAQNETQRDVSIWLVEYMRLNSNFKLEFKKYESPLHNPKTKYTVKRGDETLVLQGQLGFDPLKLGTLECKRLNSNCFDRDR